MENNWPGRRKVAGPFRSSTEIGSIHSGQVVAPVAVVRLARSSRKVGKGQPISRAFARMTETFTPKMTEARSALPPLCTCWRS